MRALRLLGVGLALLALTVPAAGQAFRRGGTEFHALRAVTAPGDKARAVLVVEFYHHGEIDAEGRNVLVLDQRHNPVPTRVLQLGPGDFCRLAFQTVAGQSNYELLYGGEPPAKGAIPAWTCKEGLLLETREFKKCDPNRLDSVREAFESARPIGAGYVETVQHGYNPFTLVAGPFLSRYSGTLHIDPAGTYAFFTSSQDASFLLIDGQLVVSAPGRHGPIYQARPDHRKELRLSAGPHSFEYYHAALGADGIMVAAWVPPWAVAAKQNQQKPTVIAAEFFHPEAIGRARLGFPSSPSEKFIPDFQVNIEGEVLLPESDQALVGVEFMNLSPPALTVNCKTLWDFGDGQTSDQPSPRHVYLRPGLYTVTLKVTRAGKAFVVANRVAVERPRVTLHDVSKQPKLDDYLPALQSYDPATMDAATLRQLVRAYRFKADQILAGDSSKKHQDKAEAERARREEARPYLQAAVDAGRTALTGNKSLSADETLLQVVRMLGPVAREQLGDPLRTGQIWQGLLAKVERPEWTAECELAIADVAINDLANAPTAKPRLEAAQVQLRKLNSGPLAARLQRVWGDYYALTGDGAAAPKAYRQAEVALGTKKDHSHQIAWQGAHSRSVEEFLRDGQWERAAEELHAWEDRFPADKIDGALTLLYARYWAAREMPDQVVALSEQLLAVNRESPYVDQLLLLAADCEAKRGRTDQALATLHALVKDYPGSPLVTQATEKIAQLESGSKK